MNKMKKYTVVFILILLASCTESKKQDKELSESRQSALFVNEIGQKIDLTYYRDYVEETDFRIGNDTLEIPFDGEYFEIIRIAGLSPLSYWVHRDSLYKLVAIDNNNKWEREYPVFTHEKDSAYETMFFHTLVREIPLLYDGYKNISLSCILFNSDLEFDNELREKGVAVKTYQDDMNKRTAFIEKNSSLYSPKFIALAKQAIFTDYVNNLLNYRFMTGDDSEKTIEAIRSCKDSIQNDELLFYSRYRHLCLAYNTFLNFTGQEQNENDKLYESAQVNFQGKTKEYLCFYYALSDIEKNEDTQLYECFKVDFDNEDYNAYAEELLQQKEEAKQIKENMDEAATEDMLYSANKELISLKDALAKYKGKIIYADFWASWCAPCRAGIPRARELSKLFADDVVFIYISIDRIEEEWWRAHKQEKLDDDKSYLMSQESPFLNQYDITSIPRYMLFDREGKLINSNAMPPSYDNFAEEMKKIIEK